MRPSLVSFLSEPGRAITELAALSATYPLLKRISPTGYGIVMTVPGFTADDGSMYVLRKYLTHLGYECYGWGLGPNTHIDPEMIELFSKKIDLLFKETGEPIHLVGHSLGGVFAREVAKLSPNAIQSVITLGSPFNDPENSVCYAAKYIYDVMNSKKPKKEIVDHLLESMKTPPECDTVCIYSKFDGIVHWTSCRQTCEHDNVRNVHLPVSHAGMAHHPLVLHKISKILATYKK